MDPLHATSQRSPIREPLPAAARGGVSRVEPVRASDYRSMQSTLLFRDDLQAAVSVVTRGVLRAEVVEDRCTLVTRPSLRLSVGVSR